VATSTTAPSPDATNGVAEVGPGPLRARRRALIWALIIVASLIGLGSILTTWVQRQMLDEQSWKDASASLVADPEVREAVSIYVVDELYASVDVPAALAERLPPNLKPLAVSAAGALREPATNAVDRLLDGPRVQQLFVNASSLAQQKLVNVLENETGHGISTGDGVVTLDLSELVTEIGTQLGVSAPALDRIPPDTGVITVMESDQLSAAQAGVQAVRVGSTLLLVLVFALFALAIYLAPGQRRQTVRNIGCALVLVGLTVLVVRRLAGNYAIDALTQPASESAGRQAWLIGSEILGQIGWASIVYGMLTLAGAILAGPSAAATAVRRWIAPVLNQSPGLAAAVIGGVFLLLIAWGPTHALRTLWGIAVLGALVAIGVAALRRETLREFPAVASPVVAPMPPAAAPAGTDG